MKNKCFIHHNIHKAAVLQFPHKDKQKSFSGVLFAAFTIFVWGITFVCTKSLLHDFSALEILVVRFLLAYITLWCLYPHALHMEHKKDELLFCAAGLSGVTVYQFLENIAITFTSASNVSIIVSICPIFAAITAQIFLHEKHITIFFVSGFVLAIIGVAFVSFNGALNFHVNPKGDFLALGSAISWGFYTLFVSKINALHFNKLAITRRIFFYALIWMIPLVLIGAFFPVAKESSLIAVQLDPTINAIRFSKLLNLINLLFLGIAASALCFAAWNVACERLGSVRATIGIYLIPVVTIVFAYFALGEKITAMGVVGALLAICGLVISSIRVQKPV
ncbi:MAG: DMT family transporter [Treponema sp.]|nr:DMT family transporter [Treponema sp.]